MNTTKISENEITTNSVQSLPTRPNAPHTFGGEGLTAAELKAAFDALPILIAERLNMLIDDICAEHGTGITDSIKTGINDSHTLKDLLDDIKSGSFISYLAAPTGTVAEYLLSLREDVDMLKAQLGTESEDDE
jgi:hypothetical protein